jgi:Flp pilus assembly protein TadG
MLTPARARAHGERGSVTVFTAVFAIAVIFLLALILDGGSALNAKERAMDIAGQAARAAADTINVGVLRTSGRAVIGPGACTAAASLVRGYGQVLSNGLDKVTSTSMVRCTAPPGSEQATVLVTVSTRPLIPGVFAGFHESAQATATPECGINQGVLC